MNLPGWIKWCHLPTPYSAHNFMNIIIITNIILFNMYHRHYYIHHQHHSNTRQENALNWIWKGNMIAEGVSRGMLIMAGTTLVVIPRNPAVIILTQIGSRIHPICKLSSITHTNTAEKHQKHINL